MNTVTRLACIAILSLAGCVAETDPDGSNVTTTPTATPSAVDGDSLFARDLCEPAVLPDAEEPEAAR